MSIPTPNELALRIGELASFPAVALRVNEALSDVGVGARELGGIIESDPALTAGLLRLANSPIYNARGQVATVERAVTVVGLRQLREVTFAICATNAFKGIPNELMTMDNFWRHSIYTAVASQKIGEKAGVCRDQPLFVMGLLHDIGYLVLFNQCVEESKQVLEASLDLDDGRTMHRFEQEVFGYDHTDVGEALGRDWGFPDSLIEGIRWHHDPYGSAQRNEAATIVHIGNSVAVLSELESDNLDEAPYIEPRALEEMNLDESALVEIRREGRTAAEGVIEIFT